MPVLIDIDSPEHHLFAAAQSSAKARLETPEAESITIGLINNMPDSALISTERQVFGLLNAAAGKIPVRLRLYTLPKVPRTDWGQQYTRRFYSDVGDLWHDSLDGLIVTGTEPQAPKLAEEPYWDSFGEVIDWASEHTVSAIWSCLAVHGAVLYLDGIDRHQLGEKCIGVFAHSRMSNHPLLQGAPSQLRVPHSRWNEVREEALTSCGYSVLTKSANGRRRLVRKAAEKELVCILSRSPGVRSSKSVRRVPEGCRPLPSAGDRMLSDDAKGIFRRPCGGVVDRVSKACTFGSA